MVASRSLEWSDGAAGPVLSMFDELTESDPWYDRALCAEVDPEIFFPEKGGSTREAKAVCRACEVRPECLEFIMQPENADVARFGIWAGMSERERRTSRDGQVAA